MTALSAENKYLLNNNMGPVAAKVGLGDLLEDALAVGEEEVTPADDSSIGLDDVIVNFDQQILAAKKDVGGAPTGTAGDENVFYTSGQCFEYHILGTQTIVAPVWSANGLNIAMDLADNDGVEISQGILSSSKGAFTAGTDRCFFEAKIKIADVSGSDDCAVGFRKAEAYQANIDDYDEMAALNVISGDVKIESILNGGTTSTTDTTENVADTEYVKLRIEVDHTAGLAAAIALAIDVRARFSSHLASATAHTTAVDGVNVIAAAVPTTLATLITLVTELLTDFDAHEGDAELASAWVYHAAQEAADTSLASAVAPTDLPECHARLNDMKAKLNTHMADTTSHGVATTAVAASDSGNVFFKVGVNGAAVDAPATVAAFSFDDGEVIVPFLYFLHASDVCDTLYLQEWKHGSLA